MFPTEGGGRLGGLRGGSCPKATKELYDEDGDCQDCSIVLLPNRKGSKSTKISMSDVNDGLDEKGDCSERGRVKLVSGSRGQEMGPEELFPGSIDSLPESTTMGPNVSNKGSDG